MNENRHDRKHLNDIDELFTSAINRHEESPSLEVWENIEKGLDRYSITQIKRKYGNLKKFAVAMVLLLFSLAIYEFQTPHVISRNEKTVSGLSENQRFEKKIHIKKEIIGTDRSDPERAIKSPPPAELGWLQATSMRKEKNETGLRAELYLNRSSDKNIAWRRNPGFSPYNLPEHKLPRHYLDGFSKLPPTADLSPLPENGFLRHYWNSINIMSLNMAVATISGRGTAENKSIVPRLNRSPFSMTLLFSPDFTSRRVKTDWPINREDNKDEIRKSERYAFSYSLGALVDYNINKSWAIQSGFTLSKAVISIAPKFIFARPDDLGSVRYKFNSSAGYSFLSPKSVTIPVLGDSLHAFSSTSSLIYGSIPFALKYKIVGKKFNFFALAGASVNILVKDKIKTSLANGMNHENAINRDIKGVKPVYYSALLAAGATYNFNRTLALSLTPTARLALTSINRDAPVKSYERSLGIVTGLQISF